MVSCLVRDQSAFKDIRMCSFHHHTYPHTHMHTPTHKYTHTHILTHTHTHTPTYIYQHVHRLLTHSAPRHRSVLRDHA